MKFTKRMILVPEHFIDTLERKEKIQTIPETKSLIRLDKKMEGILENDGQTVDDKAFQYNQDLQRFLDVQVQKRQHIPTVKIHKEEPSNEKKDAGIQQLDSAVREQEDSKSQPLTETEILSSIPKNIRTLAQSMINRLQANNDQISWNDKGEVSIDNQVIPGSNIIDLVNDQLKSRKSFNPIGWKLFTESLDRINMPKYLMRNEKRRTHIVNQQKEPFGTPVQSKPSTSSSQFLFPPTPPSTPKTPGKQMRAKRFKSKRLSDNWLIY